MGTYVIDRDWVLEIEPVSTLSSITDMGLQCPQKAKVLSTWSLPCGSGRWQWNLQDMD